MFEVLNYDVCTDCAFYIANNDLPLCEVRAKEISEGCKELGNAHINSGETCFSWCKCDGCGTPLGGDRFQVDVLV